MKIFVGLGNYEDRYKGTRHNIGRDFLIWFADKNNFSDFKYDKYSNSKISYGILNGKEIEIVLPETYMNLSGESISKYLKDKDVTVDDIFVFQDDVDMNFGEVKLKEGEGGSGGHNGIKSLFDHLKRKDFKKVKIGIIPKKFFGGFKKPSREKVSDFVLSKFSVFEKGKMEEVFEKVEKVL